MMKILENHGHFDLCRTRMAVHNARITMHNYRKVVHDHKNTMHDDRMAHARH
jgi:hypothetical protein